MPLIAATPGRRSLPTPPHPETDHYALALFHAHGVERPGGIITVVPWVATPESAEAVMRRHPERLADDGHHVRIGRLVEEARP